MIIWLNSIQNMAWYYIPFISVFLIILFLQLICFLIAYIFQTDKLTDVSYGGTFVIVVINLFIKNEWTLVDVLLAGLVILRGLRLGIYLLSRIHRMWRDKRFDTMRSSFFKFGAFRVLQAVSIFILLFPVILVMSKQVDQISIFVYLWWAISLLGIWIETLADRQKYQFKKAYPKRRCDVWLWSKARHPNYFGEMLVWWGIWVVCMPYLAWRRWLTILSPLWITFLLLKVSGIPLLASKREEKYGADPEFQAWKKRTRLLMPL